MYAIRSYYAIRENLHDAFDQRTNFAVVPSVSRRDQIGGLPANQQIRFRILAVGRSPIDDEKGQLSVDVHASAARQRAVEQLALAEPFTGALDERVRDRFLRLGGLLLV